MTYRHRHRIVRAATFVAIAVLCTITSWAQPDVELFWKTDAPRDTVIDFGVTLQGFPVTRTLYVRNRSTSTVVVERQRPDADPYFIIINDTVNGVPPEAPNKEEYERASGLPVYVPPGETGSIQLRFRAVAGDPRLPPDVVNRCLLDIRLADSAAPLGPSTDRRFILLGMKTTRILASTSSWIRFDSVWVDPRPQEPTRPYTISNVIARQVDVDAQRIRMLTPVLGSPEISVDSFQQVSFPERGDVTWTVRYRPRDRGRDSARFVVTYRPEPTSAPDSVVTTISGIGVEQRLRLLDASGTPSPVVVRGDTIDFGDVPADEVGATARIVVANEGNCSIGIVAEDRLGTTRDSAAFVIDRALRADGPTIPVGQLDTLAVRFVPTNAGAHLLRYVVRTDLRSRSIVGVPDGVQDVTFFLKGRGLRPQLQLSPSELDFGSIVLLDDCTSEARRTMRIANVGNADLRIDSITTDPPGAPIRFDRTLITIRPGSQEQVDVVLQPSVLGLLSGRLRLHSNGLRQPVEMSFRGLAVPPDSITVRMPNVVRARPGRVVQVPVVVDGDRAAMTSRCVMRVSYDPLLLRFRSLIKLGTGAEGATELVASESSPGVLDVDVAAAGNFADRDTLLFLTFDTFLGRRASTEVAIADNGVSFGNAGCANVLTVRTTSGRFELDSVCGLSYKTVVDDRLGTLAAVYPNPASGSATLTVVVDRDRHVSARLISAQGGVVHTLVDAELREGMHLLPIPLADLDAGVYVIDVVSGRRRTTLPLVRMP